MTNDKHNENQQRSYKLRKNEILRGYNTFSEVFSHGNSFEARAIRMFVLGHKDKESAVMAGFAVSRSVRRAVDRNRAKRLLREAYRHYKHLLWNVAKENKLSLSIVFVVKSSNIEQLSLRTIEDDMKVLFKKISTQHFVV
ncbi:MAG TPA: ribonuclease P protein component [Bacteroidota bacterium]|nr:ribonuclease P protein component [Bacteroidota bacterium]